MMNEKKADLSPHNMIKIEVEKEWEKMLKNLLDHFDIKSGDIPPELAVKIDNNKEEIVDRPGNFEKS